MFLSGPATTPFFEDSTLEPCTRVIKLDANFVPQVLPTSKKNWTSHEYLSDIIGDDILNSAPVIEITSGGTDYLDLVKPTDFVDSKGLPVCIIKGLDPFKRHYVSFGAQLTTINTNGEQLENEYYIYTIFRRYTDHSSFWVMCKSHYSKSRGLKVDEVLDCSTSIGESGREKVKELFDAYKNNNKGIKGLYSVFDMEQKEYVKVFCVLKLYCPAINEINKDNQS
jgi:hypothetical protein